VQACWASAFGPRVAAYRRQHGLMGRPSMAVILQPMVPASAAGVVFTADPTTGDRQRMVIAVTAGLGDRLVSGVSAGDTLYVDRASGAVDGVSSVLAGAPLADLVRWADLIEAELGGPQDIEFAVADGRIAILQSRPITGLPAAQKARGARPWTGNETILWDNANITESYAGPTSPLTRSVIRRAYAGVYAQFLALVGAGKADDTVLRTLLGFYHGQVYYQLGSWYTALALLPAFEHNRGFMEQMMGVKQAAEIRPVQRGRGRVKLAAWSLRMLWLHVRSEALVHAFLAHVEAVVTAQRARDLDELTPRDLFDLYTDLDRRILGRWQAPILTDFFAMIFFGLLRRMSERWLSDSPGLSNVLLAGDDDIESLVPVRRVAALAAQVGEDPVWSARFATQSPEEIWQALQASSDAFPVRLRAGFEDYLARYGDRCMNELKLETPTPRDQPAQLVRLVQAAVRTASRSAGDSGNGSAAAPAGDANAARAAAEARVARLGLPQRILFRSVLGHARRHVRNRENMRFARTRVFGLLRRLFLSMGRRFAAAGWLDSADDVFWLTEAEVFDMVTGTAITADLRGLAALRRAEQARYDAMPPPPERFETRGLPYLGPPARGGRRFGRAGRFHPAFGARPPRGHTPRPARRPPRHAVRRRPRVGTGAGRPGRGGSRQPRRVRRPPRGRRSRCGRRSRRRHSRR
jgi:pyruvate,water dikinase